MKEEDVGLDELSAIACRFKKRTYTRETDGFYCPLLISAFDGAYRHGAAGNDDGIYMSAMLQAGFAAWQPLALVIDLRKLAYEWGDMMSAPLTAADDYRAGIGVLATTVVASGRNERALRSLIEDELQGDPDDWLFASVDIAVDRVLKKFRAKCLAAGYSL